MATLPQAFTFEWANAFREGVLKKIGDTTGSPVELANASSWRFEAFTIADPASVALAIYPVELPVAPAGPGVPGELPADLDLSEHSRSRPDIAAFLLENLPPRPDMVVVVDATLPAVRDLGKEWTAAVSSEWVAQVNAAATDLQEQGRVRERIPIGLPLGQVRWNSDQYEEHTSFPLPDDPDVALWRYMSLSKLVDLFSRSALWLSRLDLLGDPFEGSLAEPNRLLRTTEPQANSMSLSSASSSFVSCWHAADVESAAMWPIYAPGGEGVAIRTTFRSLIEAVEGDRTFRAGRVRYVDYRTEFIPEGNVFDRIMHKRLSFEHEREIRLVSTLWEPDPPPGLHLAIDLETMIDRVHVSPGSPGWYHEAVAAVIDRFGIGCEVRRSDLDSDPIL